MSSSKQIKIGAMLSYLSIAVNIISGFFYTPWMVSAIGKNQYGLYTLANSVITLFLLDFGLSSATSKYLSQYNAEGNSEAAERFLGAVYRLYLLIDAVILVILLIIFFMIDKIFVNLTTMELAQFRIVYAISAIFSVINFPFVTFNGILTAYEKFVPLKISDLLYRLCNVVFTVIALILGFGLYAMVTIHAVVGLLVLAVKYAVIRKTVPIKADFSKTDVGIYKEIFGFSIWVMIATVASRLVFNITPTILGVVVNSSAIAVFGIVSTIEGYAYSVTTAINGMFMPQISRIVTGKRLQEELNPLFLYVGKFQYILNGLILAGFVVVGRSFVNLWMGQDFGYAYWGVIFVLFPGLFYNALEIANITMTVTDRVKQMAQIAVITGIVNVCLSFPLSRKLGVIGACISICVAYIVRSILLIIIYRKELLLDIPRFVRECYLRMSSPILFTIVCGMILNHYVLDGGWGIFLIKSAITISIYALATVFLASNKQERQLFLSWLQK